MKHKQWRVEDLDSGGAHNTKYHILDDDDLWVAAFIDKEERDRTIADHNALAGVENPGEAMKLVKKGLWLRCPGQYCSTSGIEFGDDECCDCAIKSALAALGETGGGE